MFDNFDARNRSLTSGKHIQLIWITYKTLRTADHTVFLCIPVCSISLSRTAYCTCLFYYSHCSAAVLHFT